MILETAFEDAAFMQIRHLLAGLALLVIAQTAAAGPLYDFEGHPRGLDEYTGKDKWTVVMIWASDCRVCNAEAPNYVMFNESHKDTDARMVGISIDGAAHKADAQAFLDRYLIDYPNLIGEPRQIAAMYTGLTGESWVGTPTFLIYDPRGTLVAAQVGAVPVPLIEKFMREHAVPPVAQAKAGTK
jgi:peroxiredoxin